MSTLLLTFANNQQKPLPTLQKEYNEVAAVLGQRASKGHFTVQPIPFATKKNLTNTLSQWKEDIELFLFSGHAGANHLELLEGAAHSEGVAALLGLCPNLKVVILNGCSTKGQVANLLDNGIPVVIATSAPVQDEKATQFSITFFSALTLQKASIQEAYQIAIAAAKLDGAITSEIGNRDIIQRNRQQTSSPLWGLYYQEAHKDLIDTWRLPNKETTLLTRLPSPDNKVIGRSKEIKNLYDQLHQAQRVVLMNGMGGIGKTTTAMAYANQFKANYQRIVWIEQIGDFTTAMTTNNVLNQHLGFTPSTEPIVDTQLILNKLSNLSGKSLLVIDNATEDIAKFKDFLPKPPAWQVLLTSRQELGFAKKIPLGFLSESAAIELFYEHYQLDKNEKAVQSILATLDYHTLTIELLAKVAQKRRIQPIDKIVALLQERGLKIRRKIGAEVGHSKGEKIAYLFPYLQVIFELGEMTDAETHLLKQFICLPATFIALPELLELLSITEEEEEKWDDTLDALDSLKEKGWLIYEEQISEGVQESSYKMHRVVQDVLNEELNPTYEDVKLLIKGVTTKLAIDQTKDNPVEKFPYLPFGKKLLEVIPSSETIDFAKFQNDIAVILKTFGDYITAKDLLEKVMKSNERNFGLEHPNTAVGYSNLATVLRVLGEYSSAKGLLEKAVNSAEQNFGSEHSNTAVSYSNLALVLQDLGEYSKAKDLLKKVIKSNEQNFGSKHPFTAVSYSNLGIVLQSLGDYTEAKKLLEKAIMSAEQNFGTEHPSTAVRYSNLALVLKDLGKYSEAKELLEKAIKSTEQNFGTEHPSTAVNYSNLALVLQNLGDYTRSKELLEIAIKSDEQNFGTEHPSTAVNYSNLASVLKDLGNYAAAKKLLKKAIKTAEQNFGTEHSFTVVRYSNFALILKAMGEYSAAKDLLEKVMKFDEQNFGTKHPSTARSYSNLATIYIALDNHSEAKQLFTKAFTIFTLQLGKNHPHTRAVKDWLDSLGYKL